MLDWETYGSTFSGRGRYGSCCNEFSLWEANIESTSMNFRPCNSAGLFILSWFSKWIIGLIVNIVGPKRCNSTNGNECDEQCDKDGCDYNPYRVGNKTFFGMKLAFPFIFSFHQLLY